MQKLMRVLAAAGVVGFMALPTAAQYPSKPIRIVVSFAAGGASDAIVRIVAQPLFETLGRPVVVDNRPGAEGAIAGELVAKSAPDGYTILFGGNTTMLGVPILRKNAELAAKSAPDGYTLLFAGPTQMLGVPTLRKNPPYDPVADFAPITSVVTFAFFLVVHPSVPAKTLPELIDYVRANPGKLNYASGNIIGVLATAQLMSLGKLEMVHVPYKGEPLAIPDLLDARVHMMFGNGAIVTPLVKEGKLRALATLLPVRSPLLPGVPTIVEGGMPRLTVVPWGGLFAPAKTPRDIVERLAREVNVILKRPDIREQLEKQALEPGGSTPNELAAFLKQQLIDWSGAARAAGLKPE